jgi:hypothetical protein
MQNDTLGEKYLREAETFTRSEVKEERTLLILSSLRFLVFAGGIALIWFGFRMNFVTGILSISGLTILFMYLLKLYSEHSEKKIFLSHLVLVNRNEDAS